MVQRLSYGGFASLVQASESQDHSQSQDPSMEDPGVQVALPVVEIAALEHGLEGEVIIIMTEMGDVICLCFGVTF